MMKFKTLTFILITFLSTGCNENRVYEEHKSSFPNYKWEKANTIEFKPRIENEAQKYQLYVAVRHIYGFQLKKLRVKVEMQSPSEKVRSKSYDLQFVSNSNEYLSECAGDYCDLEVLLEDNFEFPEAGTYTFTVSHEMNIDPIPNVMQVGVIIDRKIIEESDFINEPADSVGTMRADEKP